VLVAGGPSGEGFQARAMEGRDVRPISNGTKLSLHVSEPTMSPFACSQWLLLLCHVCVVDLEAAAAAVAAAGGSPLNGSDEGEEGAAEETGLPQAGDQWGF
jgi:hypothetical protein